MLCVNKTDLIYRNSGYMMSIILFRFKTSHDFLFLSEVDIVATSGNEQSF